MPPTLVRPGRPDGPRGRVGPHSAPGQRPQRRLAHLLQRVAAGRAPTSTRTPGSSTGRRPTSSTAFTQIPFTVSDGQLSVTKTTTITVLNVNAPPQFDYLGDWRVAEGQDVRFRAFAFDPNNPGFVPQDRTADGILTPLDGTDPTITYTASGLPAGATFDPTRRSSTGRRATPTRAVRRHLHRHQRRRRHRRAAQLHGERADHGGQRQPGAADHLHRQPDRQRRSRSHLAGSGHRSRRRPAGADGRRDHRSRPCPAFATFVDNGDGTGTFTSPRGPTIGGNYTMTLTATDNGDGGGQAAVLSASQMLHPHGQQPQPAAPPGADRRQGGRRRADRCSSRSTRPTAIRTR